MPTTRLRDTLWLRLFAVFALASTVPTAGAGVLAGAWLGERARSEAEAQLGVLADLGGSLIRRWIEGSRDKLTTLGRSLSSAQGIEAAAANDEVRRAVTAGLRQLIEPPDVFLDLHYYAAGTTPRFVGNAAQSVAGLPRTPAELERQQLEKISRNVQSPVVQAPLNREPFETGRIDHSFGFATLPLSVPVERGGAAVGAIVGYLDLREVPGVLDAIADAGCRATVLDGDGGVVGATGAVAGAAIAVTRRLGHADWTIRVERAEARVFAGARAVRRHVAWWTAFGVALAIALSVGLSAWIARPVRRLTAAAQRMAAGDLSARAAIARRDELGRLGAAFDTMAAALERLDSAKSQFVRDVSHELRTPLTSMRLSLENVLDGLVGGLDDAARASLRRVHADVDRLARTVDDLLRLARLEVGVDGARRADVDLAAAARACADGLAALAAARDARIDVRGSGRAHADADLVHRMLVNVCDNAIKYAPRGAVIDVEVGPDRIAVANPGAGLEPEHVREFARGGADGGAGLGLAIVQKLLALHGGRLDLRTEDGPRTVVTLVFAEAADG